VNDKMTVRITLDGRSIEADEGKTILQVARGAGIEIPTLCHYQAVDPYGACRVCVVEIVDQRGSRLTASCSYPVHDGLKVNTASERVLETRKVMVELLLARAPDSPNVRALADQLGVTEPEFKEDGDCILCGLCVRVCEELMGVAAINFEGRGPTRKVTTPFEEFSEICMSCGACAFVCPTGARAVQLETITGKKPVPSPAEFDEGLCARPNISVPFPQAVPNTPSIDPDNCVRLQTGKCGACEAFCDAGAIVYDMQPEEVTLNVGSILLAPGFEPFTAIQRGEYGYGIAKNVITSLEFERILSASGPYQGHVLRPSDRTEPKRVAWIQCVGSRDRQIGNDYCSGVCCMYAIKESIMAVDHVPGLEATIFYNDIRAYGKGFEAYYEGAKKNYGVQFKRGIISSVKERQQTNNLVLTYVAESGEISQEEFDLVVLSIGLRPSQGTAELADTLGVERNRFGFCQTEEFTPSRTTKDGIYVAGAFAAPMDIPETVMTASGAAALVGEELTEVRGTMIREKTYPTERDVSEEEPRVGVFVCRCGTNIARVVEAQDVVEYAKTLPGVAHADENLYTCSTDTQSKIIDSIREHNLNRVVVASCTPRTHEPLFQDTLREAGLNRQLFEMANIRDQCSWVHYSNPDQATFKAKDLVRMAVARAATLEPFKDLRLEVDQRAIVLGAGIAGMTAALSLAAQGFEVTLVERDEEPGGIARRIHHTLGGGDPQALLADLIDQVKGNPKVKLYTGATIEDFSGHVGRFRATINADGRSVEIGGGAVIVATGGSPYEPTEYGYPDSDSIITQLELEDRLEEAGFAEGLNEVVMIQCVGSREEEHQYCSRICCQEAVKNALAIKRANPKAQVYVLFRDIRTYGFDEIHYEEAREAGVVFIRFEPESKPEVNWENGLRVTVTDDVLQRPVELKPDFVVLSAAIRPDPDAGAVSQALKVPLNADGFFLEAHMKLRPLDFPTDGVFLAGLAHAPKTMAESISQAKGAAARAATVISQPYLDQSGIVSEVDGHVCAACLTCVRLCPYDVPQITEEGVAYIEPASCQGCGVCASACPRKAIVTRHYSDDQIVSKIDVLFGDTQFETACCAAAHPGEES